MYKILIVEDDMMIAKTLSSHLKNGTMKCAMSKILKM